jgi:Na+-transporting NADH:ubiquinone oxidoreductase subunit NqrE
MNIIDVGFIKNSYSPCCFSDKLNTEAGMGVASIVVHGHRWQSEQLLQAKIERETIISMVRVLFLRVVQKTALFIFFR